MPVCSHNATADGLLSLLPNPSPTPTSKAAHPLFVSGPSEDLKHCPTRLSRRDYSFPSFLPVFFYGAPGERTEIADGPSLGLSGLRSGLNLERIEVDRGTSQQEAVAGGQKQGRSAVACEHSLQFRPRNRAMARFSFHFSAASSTEQLAYNCGSEFLPRGWDWVWTLPQPLGSRPEEGILCFREVHSETQPPMSIFHQRSAHVPGPVEPG